MSVKKYYPIVTTSSSNIIKMLRRLLSEIDPLYIDVAERTAFLTMEIAKQKKLEDRFDFKTLYLLSVFFNIGSYRYPNQKEATDYLVKTLVDQTVYSYLFLKHMCIVGNAAETVFFHHTDYEKVKKIDPEYAEYASLIFSCTRISILIKERGYDYTEAYLRTTGNVDFSGEYTDFFLECDKDRGLTNALKNGSFYQKLDDWCDVLGFPQEDAPKLMNMLAYSMDFKSSATVIHSLNVAQYAAEICAVSNFSDEEINEVFVAGVLHDIGKMGIPIEILECPGKLSEEQMDIMRTHVLMGYDIYKPFVTPTIADIAVRHHEMLNGKGYPNHITAKDLTIQQKVLSIADVVSALTDARSYKRPFSKDETIGILNDYVVGKKLDGDLVSLFIDQYDEIMNGHYIDRTPIIASFGLITRDFYMLEGYNDIPKILELVRES